MTQYVSVLEEWDDIVGEDWEHPENNFLNPAEWLDNNPLESFSLVIKNLLEKAFERADTYIKNCFSSFLMAYWENQQIDV